VLAKNSNDTLLSVSAAVRSLPQSKEWKFIFSLPPDSCHLDHMEPRNDIDCARLERIGTGDPVSCQSALTEKKIPAARLAAPHPSFFPQPIAVNKNVFLTYHWGLDVGLPRLD
jgi:hypothetical protein